MCPCLRKCGLLRATWIVHFVPLRCFPLLHANARTSHKSRHRSILHVPSFWRCSRGPGTSSPSLLACNISDVISFSVFSFLRRAMASCCMQRRQRRYSSSEEDASDSDDDDSQSAHTHSRSATPTRAANNIGAPTVAQQTTVRAAGSQAPNNFYLPSGLSASPGVRWL